MPNLPTRPFALVARADAAPAVCFRCGNDSMLIDMGSEKVPGFGVLYLCMNCFGELCAAARVIDQRQYDETVRQLSVQLEASRKALLDHQNTQAETITTLAPASPWSTDAEELHGLINRLAGLLDRLDPDGAAAPGGSAVAAPDSLADARVAAWASSVEHDILDRLRGGDDLGDAGHGDDAVRSAFGGVGEVAAAEPASDGGLLEGFDGRDFIDGGDEPGDPV
jgi:hypothetical protein